MNRKALVPKLRALLDASDSTGEFLQAVVVTIEGLYAESEGECPEGFTALDQAVQAFTDAEG